MIVKALIVEQLKEDGTLRSFMMRPASQRDLIVAFGDEYDDERSGPFHFHDDRDARRYQEGFARCRARKLGDHYFRHNADSTYHVKTRWLGIPTEKDRLSYYALSLPKFGVPQKLSVADPQAEREYRRTVTLDERRNRYVVYLRCASSVGSFNFELSCDFVLDPDGFLSSNYQDDQTQTPGSLGEDWSPLLREDERNKVWWFLLDVEAGALQRELLSLLRVLQQEPSRPEQAVAISAVADAEAAARDGNGATALEKLKKAGPWVGNVATKIGENVASEAIKVMCGLK